MKRFLLLIIVLACVLSCVSCGRKAYEDPLRLAKSYSDSGYNVKLIFEAEELSDALEGQFAMGKIYCMLIIEPESGVDQNWYSKYGAFVYYNSDKYAEEAESFWSYRVGSLGISVIFKRSGNLIFYGSQSLWDEIS